MSLSQQQEWDPSRNVSIHYACDATSLLRRRLDLQQSFDWRLPVGRITRSLRPSVRLSPRCTARPIGPFDFITITNYGLQLPRKWSCRFNTDRQHSSATATTKVTMALQQLSEQVPVPVPFRLAAAPPASHSRPPLGRMIDCRFGAVTCQLCNLQLATGNWQLATDNWPHLKPPEWIICWPSGLPASTCCHLLLILHHSLPLRQSNLHQLRQLSSSDTQPGCRWPTMSCSTPN